MKDEIDDIRESLDRLEAESQRRKNKLLEQVYIMNMMIIVVIMMISVVIVRIMIKQEENLLVELGFLILLDLSLFLSLFLSHFF